MEKWRLRSKKTNPYLIVMNIKGIVSSFPSVSNVPDRPGLPESVYKSGPSINGCIKRILLFVCLVLLGENSLANMASPITEGTLTANPFLSRHVDILHEKLVIIPDRDFRTALIRAEYFIKANRKGIRIPLLFYASEFGGRFRVWCDEKELDLKSAPDLYQNIQGQPFNDFAYLFDTLTTSEDNLLPMHEDEKNNFYVTIDDLKYFEADISEGQHAIRVEYIAENWLDRSGWVNKYSFRYALSPAKYWRSFGTLEVVLDGSNSNLKPLVNLGEPASVSNGISTWKFTSLPVDVIMVSFAPETNKLASTLIKISPKGIMLIVSVILATIHFIGIYRYRRSHQAKYSWVMIAGSVVMPLMMLISYMYAFNLIDTSIGPDASRYHGYTFFILLLYPIIMPTYWLAMWLCDRWMKKLYASHREEIAA
jgi:hypothetical protein